MTVADKRPPRPPGDRGQGRPAFRPTAADRRLVATLRGVGTSPEQIAVEVGCAPSTLRKHFKSELARGRASLVARIGVKLAARALAGDVGAARYYLACFGGPEWRPASRHEHAGPDGMSLNPPRLVVHFLPGCGDADAPDPLPLVLAPGL